MKKAWKKSLVLAAAATLLLAACGDSKDEASADAPTFAAGSTMEKLQKAGKVNIGVKIDQAAFGLTSPITGKPEGFDVEIAKLVAQGIYGGSKDDAASKINFVESQSKDREAFITQGKVDLIVATYTINGERKKVIDFAGPYYMAHGDVLVKSSNDTIKTLDDLNGKKVCVVQGSTYPATISAKAPKAEQLPLANYSTCEQAVKDNRVEAMATDGPILIGLASKSEGSEKVLGLNYTDEPYGIGLKKGDQAFRDFVNDQLQKAYDDGEWKKAFESTVGKVGIATPQPPVLDRYTAS